MSLGDCFLKIVATKAGVIKGESADPEFPSYIPITAWTWGVRSAQDAGRSGKAQSKSFDFVCGVDTSFAALVSLAVSNDLIKVATLENRRAGGANKTVAKAQKFLTMTFKNARLTNVDVNHSEADLIPKVRGSMIFEVMEIDYTAQAEHGGHASGSSSYTWQIAEK
jgi:type VI protein secretion system component Hcp